MRINRIGLKLGAVIIALFIIILTFLGLVIDRVFSSFYHTKMKEDVQDLATHFASMAKSHDTSSEEMMQTYADFSNVSIYLIHLNTGDPISLGRLKIQDAEFLQPSDLAGLRAGHSLFREFAAQDGESYFVSARPVPEEGIAIYVLSSMQSMDESLRRVRSYLLLSGGGAFALALGFTYVVSQILSRPMVQMEQATRRIAKGELETRVEVRSSDEIGNLGAAINDLARDLQHYRDTRQEFFANISHELRTPITYLEGYAKVLTDGLYDSEEEKVQYLTIIYQESLRLSRLIHDLFELSKMEEGKIHLLMEWLDLSELAENSVQKVQLKAREKGLSLHYEKADIPLVYADGLRMEQVVLNILENAIRYTEQGTIRVRLSAQPESVHLIVEDTGRGIPQEELPYIFERFYRVEKSRSREHGGSGLGLAIVKKLMELQGGTVEVASEPGAGTRFVISLPTSGPA
ncbi:sensor histidine kinase [Gorillibacterium sp. sgz5001074]|uniref:sensor histidine kinase n=1 Tax=Gorillibacterium sp. sgz5001074 TaxID=3446695 RepID=UPI003F67EBFF